MEKPAIPEIHGYLWRPETHTFHLPCGECTITLEDVALQLGLPMDGLVIKESVIVSGKKDLYTTLLGKVQDKFEAICHIINIILGDVSGHGTECGVDQWLTAPAAVMGLVQTTVSTSQCG
ncbi:hypothetical protein Gotri_014945 [Gossypium trilobum]|uniref:Aminotransferase-like plant mobile domain-containing protein n=1 Tax=Gossypium trilobum TaxID=34281 RepID=A0A7J9DYZ5_9ROSI|nr:hypothetical protein [Gossypium trilobum]